MRWEEEHIILADPDILSETHLPTEIHARESQLKEIGACLRAITEVSKAMNCWLHGKPGVGKTANARWTLRKLESEASIRGVYVNCWENSTFFSALECIARMLRMEKGVQLDVMVCTKEPKIQHLQADRKQSDIDRFVRLAKQVERGINSEVFYPSMS